MPLTVWNRRRPMFTYLFDRMQPFDSVPSVALAGTVLNYSVFGFSITFQLQTEFLGNVNILGYPCLFSFSL